MSGSGLNTGIGAILEWGGNTNRGAAVYGRVVPIRKEPMSEAVTEATFEQEVIQSDKPVLVDFWAEWCGPCHAVAPVLDKIVEEQAGELRLVKVNIDEEQALAQRFGVMSIPTMILFKDGEPAAAVIGAQPKGAIERALGIGVAAA